MVKPDFQKVSIRYALPTDPDAFCAETGSVKEVDRNWGTNLLN